MTNSKRRFTQFGFAMMEALIAAGIVLIAALGLSVATQQMAKTRSKVQTATLGMSLESALQAKLQDKTTYASIQTALAQGQVSAFSGFSFPIEVPWNETFKTTTVTVGQDTYLDKNLNPASTPTGPTSDWLFRLKVDVQKNATAVFPVYALAYRIDFNSAFSTMATIGTLNATGFSPTDYKWAVPPEAYVDSTRVPCDTANKELFITGVNKDTGQVYCIKLADSVTCAPNEVASGWRVVGGQVQVYCKSLTTATVAAPYAVQNFTAATSDTSITGTAAALTDSPWPLQPASGYTVPYTGRSVTGSVCPPNYSFSGTCTAIGTTSWPGYVDVGCPAGYSGGPTWNPVPPTGVGAISNTSSGANVNCDLSNPVQPTGSGYDAGWDANIQVSGSCVLNYPATVPL